MTVQDLIDLLKRYNPNERVMIVWDADCHPAVRTTGTIQSVEFNNGHKDRVVIKAVED